MTRLNLLNVGLGLSSQNDIAVPTLELKRQFYKLMFKSQKIDV